jgi:hypothetical protein
MNWKLSPSDLVFLYEECQRCFYLKVRGLLTRPRTPMPKIFTKIDALMKAYLQGQRTDRLAVGIPRGTFEYAERWVESEPLMENTTPPPSGSVSTGGSLATGQQHGWQRPRPLVSRPSQSPLCGAFQCLLQIARTSNVDRWMLA